MLQRFGHGGMSDDEDVPTSEHGVLRFRRRPGWRSKSVCAWMGVMDIAHNVLVAKALGKDRRGNKGHTRLASTKDNCDNNREPVPQLPRSAYSGSYLQGLDMLSMAKLRLIEEDYIFEFPKVVLTQ